MDRRTTPPVIAMMPKPNLARRLVENRASDSLNPGSRASSW